MKPKSAVGEMLAYYYQAQPHLFKEVIERQFAVLAEERDAKEAAEEEAAREQQDSAKEGDDKATSSMDLTLYRCATRLDVVCATFYRRLQRTMPFGCRSCSVQQEARNSAMLACQRYGVLLARIDASHLLVVANVIVILTADPGKYGL